MTMLSSLDIETSSVRLNIYYSSPSYVDSFGSAKICFIPKSSATLNGSLGVETHHEGLCQKHYGVSRRVSSEKQFGIWLLCRQEDAWMDHSAEAK